MKDKKGLKLKKKKEEEQNIQEYQDNYKGYNICVIGIPEREERKEYR